MFDRTEGSGVWDGGGRMGHKKLRAIEGNFMGGGGGRSTVDFSPKGHNKAVQANLVVTKSLQEGCTVISGYENHQKAVSQLWLSEPSESCSVSSGYQSHQKAVSQLWLWEPPEDYIQLCYENDQKTVHTYNSGYESHEKTFQLTLVMRATRRLLTTLVIRATRILFSQLWLWEPPEGCKSILVMRATRRLLTYNSGYKSDQNTVRSTLVMRATRRLFSELWLWKAPEGCKSTLVMRATRWWYINFGCESHNKASKSTLVMSTSVKM